MIRLSEQEVYKLVGVVDQNPYIFNASLYENITMRKSFSVLRAADTGGNLKGARICAAPYGGWGRLATNKHRLHGQQRHADHIGARHHRCEHQPRQLHQPVHPGHREVRHLHPKKPYHFKVRYSDEIRSCAMGIREPCQVGNKAALSGTSHVPRGSRVELYRP